MLPSRAGAAPAASRSMQASMTSNESLAKDKSAGAWLPMCLQWQRNKRRPIVGHSRFCQGPCKSSTVGRSRCQVQPSEIAQRRTQLPGAREGLRQQQLQLRLARHPSGEYTKLCGSLGGPRQLNARERRRSGRAVARNVHETITAVGGCGPAPPTPLPCRLQQRWAPPFQQQSAPTLRIRDAEKAGWAG
jgi:hypothetical protein